MEAFLDGERMAEQRGVATAIESARDQSIGCDRLLISIMVDGEPISDEMLDTPPEDFGGVGRLEMGSVPRQVFLTETLADARESIVEVKDLQQEAAGKIQEGAIEEAAAPLARVLETWAAVRTILEQAGALGGVDPMTLQVDLSGRTVAGSELIQGLVSRLESVRESLTGQDWGGLSDELAYEFNDQADAWDSLLGAMSDRVCPAGS